MSDQTYMVEKGVLVRLRFRTANFTEPHELTEDEALLTDARVVMASMLAELEAAKAREEAAARHWMGEATTEDNILLNNLAGEYRDRTLAASEPPGETGPTY